MAKLSQAARRRNFRDKLFGVKLASPEPLDASDPEALLRGLRDPKLADASDETRRLHVAIRSSSKLSSDGTHPGGYEAGQLALRELMEKTTTPDFIKRLIDSGIEDPLLSPLTQFDTAFEILSDDGLVEHAFNSKVHMSLSEEWQRAGRPPDVYRFILGAIDNAAKQEEVRTIPGGPMTRMLDAHLTSQDAANLWFQVWASADSEGQFFADRSGFEDELKRRGLAQMGPVTARWRHALNRLVAGGLVELYVDRDGNRMGRILRFDELVEERDRYVGAEHGDHAKVVSSRLH